MRKINRRQALGWMGATALTAATSLRADTPFRLRYVLSSALYGDLPLDEVLAQVNPTGSEGIDIWRKVHADHREQIEAMGDEAFQTLLKKHNTALAISTCYPLGPYGRDDEMRWVKSNGGFMTVCAAGSMGENNASGAEAERQVKAFFEKLKPHIEVAESLGVITAIENHANSLLSHPDSIRAFVQENPSKYVGIAFAPHHLHQHVEEIPGLIRAIGAEQLPFFYCQEHSESSRTKMDKEIELQQLPGFGSLDYVPIVAALKEIRFTGLAEIFMHPVPRGIPILPTADEITAVVNRSRDYLEACLKQV